MKFLQQTMIVCVLLATASPIQANETYTVKPGDTLSEIAEKLQMWKLLWQANDDIVSNPNLIYPGQQLVVPDGLGTGKDQPVYSSANAPFLADLWEVAYVGRGDAHFVGEGGANIDITQGQGLRQIGVFTVKNGPARIRVYNDTEIVIYGNSRVKIKGFRQEENSIVRRFELLEGRMRVRSNSGASEGWLVEAAGAELAFENARIDVELENTNVAKFSTYDGLAKLNTNGGQTEVAGNQGIRFTRRKTPVVVALPDAPVNKGPDGVVGTNVKFSWNKPANVKSYYLTIAKDATLDEVYFEGEVYGTESFEMAIADIGTYYWTVDSISEDGFPSRPTPPLRLGVEKQEAAPQQAPKP